MHVTSSPKEPLPVLFVCTENAGRSQIAEALLQAKGGDAFHVASAGSHPARRVHPLAVDVLREQGIDWSRRAPKGFDAVVDRTWDLIITLCDRAREQCPAFPGQPVYAHWRMADPAAVAGDDTAQRHAFHDALMYLRQRIDYLLLFPPERLRYAAQQSRTKAAPTSP